MGSYQIRTKHSDHDIQTAAAAATNQKTGLAFVIKRMKSVRLIRADVETLAITKAPIIIRNNHFLQIDTKLRQTEYVSGLDCDAVEPCIVQIRTGEFNTFQVRTAKTSLS